MKLIIEGWRFLPFSYAIVNQFQLLEFLQRPNIELFHREMPYLSDWTPKTGLLPKSAEDAIRNIPEPAAPQSADATLRMHMPLDFSPSNSTQTFVWGLTEYGVVRNELLALMGVDDLGDVHRNSDATIVTSSQWSRQGFINSGADGDRVLVVPIGVDTDIYKPLPKSQRTTLRQQWGLDDYFVFLHIGSMTDIKGIRPLLKAFARICDRYPHARLLLKGTESIYVSQNRIQSAMKAVLNDTEMARVAPRIAYIGKDLSFPEVARLYQIADAYVSPYLAEGYNMPVLEAMACGVPTICTRGGSTDDFTHPDFTLSIDSQRQTITVNQQRRWILNPNLNQLVDRMVEVIENPHIFAKVRQSAPEFVAQNLTWKHVIDRWLEVMGESENAESESAIAQTNLKLNLGCGATRLDGYINVDKFGDPDLRYDLETFPWPWLDNSVGEVLLIHVLEHLGQHPTTYFKIIQELYRICQPNATLKVIVPHHRHDNFHSDPTHVRAITPLGLAMFSQRLNRQWIQSGFSCSTLGLNLNVNFELIETKYKPSQHWFRLHPDPNWETKFLLQESALYNNLIEEIHMVLRVIK